MGDRVSVQFQNGKDKSVVLFAHWGGREFPRLLKDYVSGLNRDVPKATCMPLERREPGTVMLDFIRWLSQNGYFKTQILRNGAWVQVSRVMSSFYIEMDERHGDNSDNGHWIWDLDANKWRIQGG